MDPTKADALRDMVSNICLTIVIVTFLLTLTYCATHPETSDDFFGSMNSESSSIKIESKDTDEEDKKKTLEDGGQN